VSASGGSSSWSSSGSEGGSAWLGPLLSLCCALTASRANPVHFPVHFSFQIISFLPIAEPAVLTGLLSGAPLQCHA